MNISEREIFLKALRHEKTEFLPDPSKVVKTVFPVNGFHERPPYNQSGKDWFGVEWIYEETGGAAVPDHQKPPLLDDIANWRDKVKFPDLDNWDWKEAARLDNIHTIDKENNLVVLTLLEGPFERLHALMGFENALLALMEEPEEVTDFFDALMDYKCRLIDKTAEYYEPDIITFHDDWGTQNNMFFSPDKWRSLIKQQIKKAVDACHRNGIFFEMHSCGKVEQVVPDFVEMGIDSFQGMSINDVPKLMKSTGNRLMYHMSLNSQRYEAESAAGTLTEEQLRMDVRNEVLKNTKDSNYIARSPRMKTWWSSAANEEIEKCRFELRLGYLSGR